MYRPPSNPLDIIKWIESVKPNVPKAEDGVMQSLPYLAFRIQFHILWDKNTLLQFDAFGLPFEVAVYGSKDEEVGILWQSSVNATSQITEQPLDVESPIIEFDPGTAFVCLAAFWTTIATKNNVDYTVSHNQIVDFRQAGDDDDMTPDFDNWSIQATA